MKKVRAAVPLAGIVALLSLGACHSSSPATTSKPVLVSPSPSVTHTVKPVPRPSRATHPAVHKTITAAPAPKGHCTIRYQLGEPLPDPACTPGSTQSTSTMEICSPGWATAHREYFTKAEREAAFAKYGIITTDPAAYGEYDHLIPLELGGSNNSDNLWPEPGKIPNAKDTIENVLHAAVCSGKIPLTTAQQEIAKDWVTVPDTFQAP